MIKWLYLTPLTAIGERMSRSQSRISSSEQTKIVPPKSRIGSSMGREPSSIPRHPQRLKLIFITEEAEPISCSCCSKMILVDSGRNRLPMKKKIRNEPQKSQGEN